MEGTARIAAPPAFDRTVEVRADAVLRPGTRAGEVSVRLATRGQACDLAARRDEAGGLAFSEGQTCPIDIQSPGASGHVEARLRAGRGRLSAGRLELSFSCELDGAVKIRPGGKARGGVSLPDVWTPEVPVRGDADVAIQGDRDRSRAAEPSRP